MNFLLHSLFQGQVMLDGGISKVWAKEMSLKFYDAIWGILAQDLQQLRGASRAHLIEKKFIHSDIHSELSD